MTDIVFLTSLIEPQATALGFDLVRVKMLGKGDDQTLQIMAERPDTRQLTIDDCAELSRRVSDMLDDLEARGADPIDNAYRLEVSSPGIDRPLTRVQDFADWAGHEARIRLVDPIDGRKVLTGDLIGAEGAGNDGRVTIDVRGYQAMTIGMDQIRDAKLTITDRLLAATAPLSSDGADEFEDTDDFVEDGASDGTPAEETN